MGRILQTTDNTGTILSSACYDAGTAGWISGSPQSWTLCYGLDNLVQLKVTNNNPYFDIEFNCSTDHGASWTSDIYRVVWWFSSDGTSWSTKRNTRIMFNNWCGPLNIPVCGQSSGTGGLFQPPGITAGMYVKFAIERISDTNTGGRYLNQNSENLDGGSDQGTSWRGGGFFIRVRELNPSLVTLRGTVNSSNDSI